MAMLYPETYGWWISLSHTDLGLPPWLSDPPQQLLAAVSCYRTICHCLTRTISVMHEKIVAWKFNTWKFHFSFGWEWNFHACKGTFCPKAFKNENSTHEIVNSPIAFKHFWEISHFHGWKCDFHATINIFIHETFRTGKRASYRWFWVPQFISCYPHTLLLIAEL